MWHSYLPSAIPRVLPSLMVNDATVSKNFCEIVHEKKGSSLRKRIPISYEHDNLICVPFLIEELAGKSKKLWIKCMPTKISPSLSLSNIPRLAQPHNWLCHRVKNRFRNCTWKIVYLSLPVLMQYFPIFKISFPIEELFSLCFIPPFKF